MVQCYIRTPDEKLIPHQEHCSPEVAAKATALLKRLLGVSFKQKSVPILQLRQNMVPQDMGNIQGSSNFIACGLYFDRHRCAQDARGVSRVPAKGAREPPLVPGGRLGTGLGKKRPPKPQPPSSYHRTMVNYFLNSHSATSDSAEDQLGFPKDYLGGAGHLHHRNRGGPEKRARAATDASSRSGESERKVAVCRFYTSPGGCKKGDNCRFAHGSEEIHGQAATQVPLPPPMSISMHPAVLGQQAMQYAPPSRPNAGQLTGLTACRGARPPSPPSERTAR